MATISCVCDSGRHDQINPLQPVNLRLQILDSEARIDVGESSFTIIQHLKVIKDSIYLQLCRWEGVGSSKTFPPKDQCSPAFGSVFEKSALFTPVVSAVFCSFPFLSEFHLHAASILQSIAVNRLQSTLLSAPLPLCPTRCGSQRLWTINRCRSAQMHVAMVLMPNTPKCGRNDPPFLQNAAK